MLARCSGDLGTPVKVAEIKARVAEEIGCPLWATLNLRLVASVCFCPVLKVVTLPPQANR